MSKCRRFRGILAMLAPVFLAGVSSAATWTVVNTNDAGAGSLCNAINSAGSGDTINFNLTYPATITLTSGTLTVSQSVSIVGPGQSNLTISGNSAYTVLSIAAGAIVNISGVAIRSGKANAISGGGVYNLGDLNLASSASSASCGIGGNSSSSSLSNSGGGIYNGGAMTIVNCVVSGNVAPVGGGIDNAGVMTLVSSTVSGNSGTSDFGGTAGGILNTGS